MNKIIPLLMLIVVAAACGREGEELQTRSVVRDSVSGVTDDSVEYGAADDSVGGITFVYDATMTEDRISLDDY